MANEKNKIKELVSDDDDATAELEALPILLVEDIESELAASTSGLNSVADEQRDTSISQLLSDLESRSATIDRLQYDIEQLRSRWLGLETEIGAREQITDKLNREVKDLDASLARKKKLLKQRDETIKNLKAEIRERHDAKQALQKTADDLRAELEHARKVYEDIDVAALQETLADQQQQIQQLEEDNEALTRRVTETESDSNREQQHLMAAQSGRLASNEALIRELRAQNARSEEYADTLRRQLQDAEASAAAAHNNCDELRQSLDLATEKIDDVSAELASETENTAELKQQLEAQREAHAEELRTLRFELGESQETVAQTSMITEQLNADLVETRGYRAELESMLDRSEQANKSRMDELENENRKLRREAKELEENLETKSQAVNCLIAELTKKTQQIESIGEIEDVIQEIDGRMSERIDEPTPLDRERVTRLLIGSVEGQELRFPLFKDRLTIGRTEQNDIQLKAAYISRRHAVIVTDGDATRVIDWGSKNGVFVNSRRVSEHFLTNGDIVAIGTAKFRYEERPKRDA